MPLQWQNVHVPLSRGMDTKSDPRALEPPRLALLENAEFEEVGGLQKRGGFSKMGLKKHAGGADLVPGRLCALAVRKDELLLFGEGKCWSWSDEYAAWTDRGRFESVLVSHKEMAHDRNDQIRGDRAQLGNVILYAWEDRTLSKVEWRLLDATTGVVFDSSAAQSVSASKPVCRAIGNRLHLFYIPASTTRIDVLVFNPTSSSTLYTNPTAIQLVTDLASSGLYDVTLAADIKDGRLLLACDSDGGYRAMTIDSAGTIDANVEPARTAAARIACAYYPAAAGVNNNVIVLRQVDLSPGFEIRMDVLSSALADVTVNVLVDTETVDKLGGFTAVSTGSSGGMVIWTEEGTTSPKDDRVKRVKIVSAALSGAIKTLSLHSRLGSRAVLWDDAGTLRTMVWVLHDTGQQPSYALIDADYTAGADIGSGGFTEGTDEVGLLANVLTGAAVNSTHVLMPFPQIEVLPKNVFACILGNRRRLVATVKDQFNERGLEDVQVTVRDPRAYRGAEEGDTLYLPGGYLAAYSGSRVIESEFLLYPEEVVLTQSDTASGALTTAKVYSYKCRWERQLDNGEYQRSAHAKTYSFTLTGANDTITVTLPTTPWTNDHQFGLVVYRTEHTPGPEAPYYRVSGLDPTVTTGNNAYVRNDHSKLEISLVDVKADTATILLEQDRWNPGDLGTELDNIPPPAPPLIRAGQARVFSLDPRDKTRVWYSKIRVPGEGIQFSDTLEIRVPQHGGDVTALEVTDSGVVIFSRQAVFIVNGQGPDNLGNNPYPAPQQVVSGIGCIDARSVVRIPRGILFKSDKGFYLLDNSFQIDFVGAAVVAYNDLEVTGAIAISNKHQARFLLATAGMLVYDYLLGEWSIWPGRSGTSMVYWKGRTVVLDASGPWRSVDAKTDDNVGFPLVAETGWIKLDGLQGYGRARWLEVLGDKGVGHTVRVRVAYNYEPTFVDDRTIAVTSDLGNARQFRVRLSRPKCEAVKVRIEDVAPYGTTEGYSLTGLSLSVGIKGGLMRLPAAQTA